MADPASLAVVTSMMRNCLQGFLSQNALEVELSRNELKRAKEEAKLEKHAISKSAQMMRDIVGANVEITRLERRRAIEERLIDLAESAFSQKAELFAKHFALMHGLISREREALREEIQNLDERVFSGELNRDQKRYVNFRIRSIKLELVSLSASYDMMYLEAQARVAGLSIELGRLDKMGFPELSAITRE